MKFALLTIFLLLSFACNTKGQGSEDVKRHRETRDKAFRGAGTPLTAEDLTNFKGLQYFDVNEKFVVKAKLEKTSDAQIFLIPATVGSPHKYLKRGILTFEFDGKSYSLIAFQTESSAKNNGSLFVPFRDLTNGKETYGAGRYLDIKAPVGDEAILDFNYAYNPACAYGRDDFSCAIPPKENSLQIEIKAGEKIFPSAEKQ